MTLSQKIIRSRLYVVSVSLLSVFIVGIADYLAPIEISLAIFYLLPISFVTWFAGRTEGIVVSSVAAVIWLTGDFLLVERNLSYPAVPYWNAIMQDGVFIIVVLLLSRLKVALLHEKEISRLKSEMLSQIGHLNLAVTATLDLASVGKSLLDTIELFFPGWAIAVSLCNERTGVLEPLVSRNLRDVECTLDLKDWYGARETLERKAPFVVQNIDMEPQTRNTKMSLPRNWVSYLGLPLEARGDVVGVLSIYTNKEHDFTEHEIAFFTTLAGQTVIALQNARLFEEVGAGRSQLRDLSRRLLELHETDQRHLARELHDEIGQILTGLQLTLEMASRAPCEESTITLAKAQSLVNDLIRRVRRLSLDLRPLMLDDLGLLPTIVSHIERFALMTGVEVDFSHNGLKDKRFQPQVETAAYRIVQEALTNVARHARVERAILQIWCIPETLILKIQDMGVGFDPQAVIRAGKASGVTGMRERAVLLNGELSIDSTSGAGTCIIAELPLGKASDITPADEQDNYSAGRRSPDIP